MEYGLRQDNFLHGETLICRLNPCFNGIWSATISKELSPHGDCVLILVLMEYGLRHEVLDYFDRHYKTVLILVLMEYGLRLEQPRLSIGKDLMS